MLFPRGLRLLTFPLTAHKDSEGSYFSGLGHQDRTAIQSSRQQVMALNQG